MTTPIRTFLREMVEAPTLEEEHVLIADEIANLRTLAKDSTDSDRPVIVAKLLLFSTLGFDTAWGQMEVVNLMSRDRFSDKRIGYLVAAHIFDEANERCVLITATIQKDLTNPNAFVQRLALTLVASVCTSEIGEAIASSVIKLTASADPTVQKCAAMAAVKILRKCPDLVEDMKTIAAVLFNHTRHSVVAAGILIALEVLKIDPVSNEEWQPFALPFTRVLRTLFETRASAEFQFGVVSDPFLQIRILQLLSGLKVQSDELDDLLSSIVTGVDLQRNAGRSILLQATSTIGKAAKKASLRGLAFSQVGRLLGNDEPNFLYSGLSIFSKTLYTAGGIVARSSADSHVLLRFKQQIVRCLDHRDPSIRRRALDVVTALVDETNAETLVPEIMAYIKLADRDFRTEMVAKIFGAVQRFGPSTIWIFDTVLKILSDSGNYVGNDVISSFCRMISNNPDLRPHALNQLYGVFTKEVDTQPVIQVAAWALGEFQESRLDIPEVIAKLLDMPQTSVETICYLVTALSKLAVRFGLIEFAKPVLEKFLRHKHLEVQQRSGELLRVLLDGTLAEQILAPVDDEAEDAPSSPDAEVSLLDLMDAPVANAPAREQVSQPPSPPAASVSAPPGSVEALRTPDYVIYFEFQRNAQNPNQLAIRSSVFGLGSIPLTQFVVQYGVPQGWVVIARQPSGNVLEPLGGPPIQQILILENRGMSRLAMITQVSYMYRTQPIREGGTINPIFD
jgi:hypothetical protein